MIATGILFVMGGIASIFDGLRIYRRNQDGGNMVTIGIALIVSGVVFFIAAA